MGGIARIAKEMGHHVTGSDANVYPPMSHQLRDCGIELTEGFRASNVSSDTDLVIFGNAMSRGNPEVEAILDRGLPYKSGPQWLAENVLQDRWVLAVAGTHGKTTGSSLLAWILDYAGLNPGYLIGGVPGNFDVSARLGNGPFFVVEADEYDTAFFDKRSKFIHYRPRTLVLNNLEFDHADIFDDLDSIKTQFHHLIRTVPGAGLIVLNGEDNNLAATLDKGCWTPTEEFFASKSAGTNRAVNKWFAVSDNPDFGNSFECIAPDGKSIQVNWGMGGRHNVANALAAIAAARHAGVPPQQSIEALREFDGIKRRMEIRAEKNGITIYDDFAHHPTAIESTLRGLRAKVGEKKIIAVLEMRSNTMRMGYHRENVLKSLKVADLAIIYSPPDSPVNELQSSIETNREHVVELIASIDEIVERLRTGTGEGDHVVIMSNGSFHGIHDKVTVMLSEL